MTLEGWTNDVVNPIRKVHPYALFFFIPFIIITTFWVLNLFIGIIVNAMQEEHAKAEAEVERDLIHGETAPLVREVQELKAEIVALRKEISAAATGSSSEQEATVERAELIE
jgi:voltage-gated sodium channel